MQAEENIDSMLIVTMNALLGYAGIHSRVDEEGTKELLTPISLSSNQIKNQKLPELESSLTKFDKIINLLKTRDNDVADTQGRAAAQQAISFLYGKKSHVLQRIKEIKEKEFVNEIVTEASVTNLEPRLKTFIATIEEAQQKIVENQEQSKEFERELAYSREERETYREKWTIRKSLLERESVSTIMGAFLLFIITVVLLIAAFLKLITFKIIEDGFLVLLGYFFGQTVAKSSSQRKEEN